MPNFAQVMSNKIDVSQVTYLVEKILIIASFLTNRFFLLFFFPQIIVGSISDCRDFGIGFQYGRFQTYFASSAKDKCTIPISTYNYHVDINKWYAVAVMNTGHIITLMVNGRIWSNSIVSIHLLDYVFTQTPASRVSCDTSSVSAAVQ